ncbi:hypothetical protein VB715_00240 [Crocosphaera sp. UHCC 0190]|uniref:hypothetical protein n=1 Tax=Crocosphaera sp. UHCC 0190 TaxID=3110246 RepID=UPI002B1FE0CF|nr:hypothetical protein [Crocosphaera sp. UHCC 0190]MEA5508182.1 hypothetical protein [Crocosphaera sp. UHCC 0190]
MNVKVNHQKVSIILIGIQFLAFFIGIFWINQDKFPFRVLGDVKLYYDYSFNLMNGKLPYRDFSVEYPPLALVPMVLPQVINFCKSLFGLVPNIRDYTRLFWLENALFSTYAALILAKIAMINQLRYRYKQVLITYALMVLIAIPLLPWRYDLFPSLLTLLSFYSLLLNQPIIAGMFLGSGILAKLYPVILMPIFFLYWFVQQNYKACYQFCLSTISFISIISLPFLLISPENYLSFLTYHKQRGLQIETLPASLILLAEKLGLIKNQESLIQYNYGAFHVALPLADFIAKILPILFLLLFIIGIIKAKISFQKNYHSTGQISIQILSRYVVIVLLIFILCNKVFSPQYIIWLLPFIPLLKLTETMIWCLICILTIIIYPFNYQLLSSMDYVMILLLNLRNFLFAFLTFRLMKRDIIT